MEVTDRFPADAGARASIADNDKDAARAFAALTAGMQPAHVLVACWVKPRLGNSRSYPIRTASALKMVMGGIREGRCTELRFFHESIASAPSSDVGYRPLFLP